MTMTVVLGILPGIGDLMAQRRAPVPPRLPQYLPYEIVNGDTVYLDTINPSMISLYGNRRGKEWRKYYRLVWNFSKVGMSFNIKEDNTIVFDWKSQQI